jgi:hypothetical protein
LWDLKRVGVFLGGFIPNPALLISRLPKRNHVMSELWMNKGNYFKSNQIIDSEWYLFIYMDMHHHQNIEWDE